MVRHLGGALQRAAVLQVSGDAGRAKCVIADLGGYAGGFGAPLNHRVGVGLRQGMSGKLDGRAAVALKQQRLRIIRKPRAVDVLMQVGCRRREGRGEASRLVLDPRSEGVS